MIPYLLRDQYSPGELLAQFWEMRNEHRPFLPRLIGYGLGTLSQGSVIPQIYLSALVLVAVLVVLVLLYRCSSRWRYAPIVALPFSILLFTLTAGARWIAAQPLQINMAVLFSVGTIGLLTCQPARWRNLLLSGAMTASASLSFSTGNMTWFVGGLALLLTGYRQWRYLAVWALMAALILVPYIVDFLQGSSLARTADARNLIDWIGFVLAFTSAAISPATQAVSKLVFAEGLGAFGLVALAALLVANIRLVPNGFRKALPWGLVALWVLLNGVQAGYGRGDPSSALTIRYMIYGCLFWISIVALALLLLTEARAARRRVERLVKALAAAALAVLGLSFGVATAGAIANHAIADVSQSLRQAQRCLMTPQIERECLQELYPQPVTLQTLLPYAYRARAAFLDGAQPPTSDGTVEFLLAAHTEGVSRYESLDLDGERSFVIEQHGGDEIGWTFLVPPSATVVFEVGIYAPADQAPSEEGSAFAVWNARLHQTSAQRLARQEIPPQGLLPETIRLDLSDYARQNVRVTLHAAAGEDATLYWVEPRLRVSLEAAS